MTVARLAHSMLQNTQYKRSPTFRLECKVAELADVGSDVGVRSDVFLQHAGLLAADATLFADVFPSSATADVDVVLVGFIAGGKKQCSD